MTDEPFDRGRYYDVTEGDPGVVVRSYGFYNSAAIALYPLLSPRENLWTFGRYQGLGGERLESAIRRNLEWIGLSDRADERSDRLRRALG